MGAWPTINIIARYIYRNAVSLLMTNPLQYHYWWTHRPRLTAIGKLEINNVNDNGIVTESSAKLTLHISFPNVTQQVSGSYEQAFLVLTQKRNGKQTKFIYRPREAGGFTSLKHSSSDPWNHVVEFVLVNAPAIITDAPDINAPYEWKLVKVKAIFWMVPPVSGFLCPLEGRLNNDAISTAISHAQIV